MTRLDDYGYLTNPTNGLGIVRARTLLGNLRTWDFPRSEQALDLIVIEIGQSPIPAIYLLFDERSEKKVYVGQTENLEARLTTHINSPEDKIRHWERAIVINDGRNASQSDLNDENIRLTLEDYLVRLFKINKYKVVTVSSRAPSLSSTQKTLCKSFQEELIILLTNKNKITKPLTERLDAEVYIDEVKKILLAKKHVIDKWGRVEAVVNKEKTFVRPGSPKSAGWQVTFRGGKVDSFKSCLAKGAGLLLMPRGPILLMPLKIIRDFVLAKDKSALTRDTVDVFFRFDESNIFLVYKGDESEVTEYSIKNYP